MIGHLRGLLADKRTNQVLVDVNGVGYQVSIPLSTFYALGELHDEVTLLIHTHLREDSIALYGFLTSREKQFFELLLSASGVGPVLALKILSGMSGRTGAGDPQGRFAEANAHSRGGPQDGGANCRRAAG